MNTKMIASLLGGVLLTGQAFAQSTGSTASAASTSSTSASSIFKKLQDSPLSLSFYHDTGFDQTEKATKGEYRFSKGEMLNIAYLGYKLTDKDSLRLENRVSTSFSENKGGDSKWVRSVLKYKRSGILTQDKHGINLSAALEKRYVPEGRTSTYGLNRVSATASRKLSDKLSLSNTLYGALYDVKDKDTAGVSTGYILNATVLTGSITDKLSLSLVQEYLHLYRKDRGEFNAKGRTDDASEMYYTIEAGYAITPKVSAAIYTAVTPFAAHDGHTTKDDWAKKYSLGANLYATIF